LFCTISALSQPGDIVLDPFCGSGTVLLEALLAGRTPVGADSNPFARALALAKTTSLPPDLLRVEAARLFGRIPSSANISAPDVVNLPYWFPPRTVGDLLRIKEAVAATEHPGAQRFFEVTFSGCVRRVSLANPRL